MAHGLAFLHLPNTISLWDLALRWNICLFVELLLIQSTSSLSAGWQLNAFNFTCSFPAALQNCILFSSHSSTVRSYNQQLLNKPKYQTAFHYFSQSDSDNDINFRSVDFCFLDVKHYSYSWYFFKITSITSIASHVFRPFLWIPNSALPIWSCCVVRTFSESLHPSSPLKMSWIKSRWF